MSVDSVLELSALEEIALTLFDIQAVRFGNFTLHSGKKSPIYIDLRVLVSYPAALRQIAQAYAKLLAQLDYDILGAYPYAGLPIGVAVSLEIDRPLVYPRKQAKSYGTGKQVEGVWKIGQRVVLIEDLITSGKSILEAMSALKVAGLEIHHAVVLIDRQQEGTALLEGYGCQVHSLMNMTQLLEFLEKNGRINSPQKLSILRDLNLA